MPFGDGTGPLGGGGRGSGRGRGMGRGMGRGLGRGNRAGAGPSGYCVCPACGEKVAHKQAVPCYSINCPKCGAKMVRE